MRVRRLVLLIWSFKRRYFPMLKRRKFPIWMAYLKTCKEYSHGERKWRAWPIRADGEFSRIILRPIRCSDTPYLTRDEHELEITVLKYVKESVGANLFFAFQFCNVSFSSPASLLPSFHLFAPLPTTLSPSIESSHPFSIGRFHPSWMYHNSQTLKRLSFQMNMLRVSVRISTSNCELKRWNEPRRNDW